MADRAAGAHLAQPDHGDPLILKAPFSVIAGMLGHHAVHTEAIAAQAGSPWKKCVPGNTRVDAVISLELRVRRTALQQGGLIPQW
jgi:hypothetical protein